MICPSLSQKKKTDGFDIIDTGAYNNNKKKQTESLLDNMRAYEKIEKHDNCNTSFKNNQPFTT